MGADAGFDMVPRLTKSLEDRLNWDRFIRSIKSHYQGDTRVEMQPSHILFKAGEHPALPIEGHKFLRFSSKITGSNAATTGVDSYIDTVTGIAKDHFGARIHYWNELYDSYGEYGWDEVNDSFKSYEQSDEPEAQTILTALLSSDAPIAASELVPFEVQEISGKGRGLIARFDIPIGTRILCEQPLIRSPTYPISATELEQYLAARLKVLPKQSQRQFLELHNISRGKLPFSNTFKSNALPLGPGSSIGAVYPTICLLNHSCLPNSHHSWNSLLEKETVHTIRPIRVGEELTIMYDSGRPHVERRRFLQESFAFHCDCRKCCSSGADLQESDTRLRLIQTLDNAIGDPLQMQTRPEQSLRNCYSLLEVLSDEYEGHAGVLNARLYYDAFQICIAHGDQARARKFAQRAYEARVVCEGEDSPETMRMKLFAAKPATHQSFEICSSRWRNKRTPGPEASDFEAYQKSLFRVF